MRAPDVRETDPIKIIQAVRQLARGRSNATGTVTLTANAATTVVSADVISADCRPVLFPTTANGSAEFGAGTIYISAVADGSFTITHANDANADKTFYWHAIGG
jgi:hypothetical protein